MRNIALSLLLGLGFAGAAQAGSGERNLAGSWRFALDREDRGIGEHWFASELPGHITLPGSLQAQGFGDEITVDTPWTGRIVDRSWFTDPRYAPYRQPGNVKVPFWLQPARHYVGIAWYQRDVKIPQDWQGKRIQLFLERPHWRTTVFVDGRRIGACNSLAVPHAYDVSADLPPGKHRLSVRVDNRYLIEVGMNAHSVSDHTQGNWNGIVGALKLVATEPVWFEDVQAFPNAAARTVRVRVSLASRTGRAGTGRLVVAAETINSPVPHHVAPREFPVTWKEKHAAAEVELPLGPGAQTWDEFHPALYRLQVGFKEGWASATCTFGLRDVKVAGTQITLNGRPLFLRGTLECCIFPLTGYPPTDVAAWKRLLGVARAHGLNHLRFHSWCPPEAAFRAADEMGFYYYVECPVWANGDSSVGDGRAVDQWVQDEGDRILRAYGNHPSFLMMSYGNEPGGKNQRAFLGRLVQHWKGQDTRRLYTSGAGWPMIPENDFHVTPSARGYPVRAKQGETAGDYRDFLTRQDRPIVSHEIGQYCAFPNLNETAKYQGLFKARNFEIVRDFLTAHGMGDQAEAFLHASGKLQVLFYKEEIEACLRTPGWAGFELLDLHDFPGQGTALVGVLDPFWEEKGYVKPEEFRRFCGETVPLARLPKRVLTCEEELDVPIEVAHFGPRSLEHVPITWRIRNGAGREWLAGSLPAKAVPTGAVTPLGHVRVPLGSIKRATALNLEVRVGEARNDWNFWVYPGSVDSSTPVGVTVAKQLGGAALDALKAGGRVVLLANPRTVAGQTVGHFDPIFWNKMWFPRQRQHTLGLLMNPSHPVLAEFPTAAHSDWQWQDLQNRSKPMILDRLPRDFRPLVQVIDDWNTCRKLGLVFEATVGKGRLLVCAIDLDRDLEQRPTARQLRYSLLTYAASEHFRPKTALTVDQVRDLFLPTEKAGPP